MDKKPVLENLAIGLIGDIGVFCLIILAYLAGVIGGLMQAIWLMLEILQRYPRLVELLK